MAGNPGLLCQKDMVSNMSKDEFAGSRQIIHEAAKKISALAKENPKIGRREKTIEVFPTGDRVRDMENLEHAVAKANPGDVILLRAKDRKGKPREFNLANVAELFFPKDFALRGEKDTVVRFSE